MDKTIMTTITLKPDTDEGWMLSNVILPKGEAAYTTDTHKIGFGDGVTKFKDMTHDFYPGPAPHRHHSTDIDGGVAVELATTTKAGIVRLSTDVEVDTAIGDGAVLSKQLKAVYDKIAAGGGVAVEPATTTKAGIVKLATNVEADTAVGSGSVVASQLKTIYDKLDAGGPTVGPATTTKVGVVRLATDVEVDTSTGDGAVLAKQLKMIYDRMKVIETNGYETIGNRSFKPWTTVKAGYRELNGGDIALDDICYDAMAAYININSDEVCPLSTWNTGHTSAGKVGGAHFYALHPDGRIRLPDTRGDYIEARGFDDRASLEWRSDAMRKLTGSFRGSHEGNHTCFASADGVMTVIGSTGLNGAARSTATAVQHAIVTLDSDKQVPSAPAIRPRAAGYMHVVYVGQGAAFIADDNNIYVEYTRSKHIGEIFYYGSDKTPPGALKLDGSVYDRDTYPWLFQHVVAQGRVIDEDAWQTIYTERVGNVDHYSYGDGTTTFRVPTYDVKDRNWPTEAVIYVQAFNAVADVGTISYDTMLNDLAERFLDLPVVKDKIDQLFKEMNTYKVDEEVFTGKYWTNGKKIYRKVVHIVGGPNASRLDTPYDFTYVDSFVHMTGMGHNASEPLSYTPIPGVWTTSTSVVGSESFFVPTKNTLSMVASTDRRSMTYDFTFEYTRNDD